MNLKDLEENQARLSNSCQAIDNHPAPYWDVKTINFLKNQKHDVHMEIVGSIFQLSNIFDKTNYIVIKISVYHVTDPDCFWSMIFEGCEENQAQLSNSSQATFIHTAITTVSFLI